MEWRRATAADAPLLAQLAWQSDATDVIATARSLLGCWLVELGSERGSTTSAICVLPPAPEHHRGYGAWWDHGDDSIQRFEVIIARLKSLADTIPRLEVLQVNAPETDDSTADRLTATGFPSVYPLWTMKHDELTWPTAQPELPCSLRIGSWADTTLDRFHAAYLSAYQDQRVVEPHSASTWTTIAGEPTFDAELSRVVLDHRQDVVAFVLASRTPGREVELGPIGTVPARRHRGISSAVLSRVLDACHIDRVQRITLTVDGDSPTGAHRLYQRSGFDTLERLTAFHLPVRH